MKELGDFAEGFHAALLEPVKAADLDLVVLVGSEMLALERELRNSGLQAVYGKPECVHCASPAEAVEQLREFGLLGGDAVLVKGSNSLGLNKVVEELIHRNA